MTLYPIRGVFFMRKKKSIIGISVVAALFMALAGCGKADNDVVQEHIDNIDDNEVVQPVEVPEEPIVKTGYTGELFTKRNAQVAYPSVTMSYTGDSDLTMTASPYNNASSVNLDENIFTVLSFKNSASGNVKMFASDKTIRFYSGAKGSSDGAALQVEIAEGYTITSVSLDIKTSSPTLNVYAGDTDTSPVAAVDGLYTINHSMFSIKNVFEDLVNKDTKTMSLNSVTINYDGPEAREVSPETVSTISSLSYS